MRRRRIPAAHRRRRSTIPVPQLTGGENRGIIHWLMYGKRLVLVVLAAAAACAPGGGGDARGRFASRQLASLRDPSIHLDPLGIQQPLFSNGRFLYSANASAGGGRSYYELDLDDGHIDELDATLSAASFVFGSGRYLCHSATDEAAGGIEVDDTVTGAATVLTGTVLTGCPTEDNPGAIVWRDDGSGYLDLFAGRFDALVRSPLSIRVRALESSSADGTSSLVIVALGTSPETFALFRVDVDLTAPPVVAVSATAIVSGALAAGAVAWAPGAAPPPSAPLGSPGLADPMGIYQTVTAQPLADHFVYSRSMDAGGVVVFAGPFVSADASELALFPIDGALQEASVFQPAPPRFRAWWRSAATTDGSGGVLRIWDGAARRLTTCPLTAPNGVDYGQAFAFGGADKILFSVGPASPNYVSTSPVVLAALDTGSCQVIVPSGASSVHVSPAGDRFVWVVGEGGIDGQLWTAAGDGSAPRQLGAGAIRAARFLDGGQVLLQLGQVGGDLAWLDPAQDSPALHDVADNVFGTAWWPSAPATTVVLGYELAPVDDTGTLGIVDWPTGDKRAISPDVAGYFVLPGVAGSDSAARVLYLVRGRNASPADGFWLTTLTADDLQ